MTIELNYFQKLKYYTFIYIFSPSKKTIKLQRSVIYNLVDQMRPNKRQCEAYKKSILTKQSKQESKKTKN